MAKALWAFSHGHRAALDTYSKTAYRNSLPDTFGTQALKISKFSDIGSDDISSARTGYLLQNHIPERFAQHFLDTDIRHFKAFRHLKRQSVTCQHWILTPKPVRFV
jgi:hypothetical protein